MDPKTKSLIRHALTAIGTIIGLIGLNAWVPVLTFLQNNLDAVWDAANVIIGLVVALYGFFFKRDQ